MSDSLRDIVKEVPKNRSEVERKIFYLVILGICAGLLVVILSNLNVNISAGMRAYVAGEGFYSKFQKSGSVNLTSYIFTEEEKYYKQFQEDIQINISDRIAREELSKTDFDRQKAVNALIEGNNHPDDVKYMIQIFRYLGNFDQVSEVIEFWEKADQKVSSILQLSSEIHEEIETGSLSEGDKLAYLERLSELDAELTQIENNFSNGIGELARGVQQLMRWSSIFLGILLLTLGIIFSQRFQKSADKWARSLTLSQDRFKSVIKNSPDVIYQMDLKDMKYDYVSPSFKELLGYDADLLLEGGQDFLFGITYPEDLIRLRSEHELLSNTREFGQFDSSFEFRIKHADGHYIWISNLRTVLRNQDGDPVKVIGNVRDISEIKNKQNELNQSLEEKEILIKEIHHRVKNNLAIINSMLEMQKMNADEQSSDILSKSQSVIYSISKIHEKLYLTTDLDRVEMQSYIEELVAEFKNTFDTKSRNISFELNVDPLYMYTKEAVSAGLILNELVTNAFKYAFEDRTSGVIRIDLGVSKDQVELNVRNNGKSMDVNDTQADRDSLGLTMIEVLVDRLEGSLQIRNENGWLSFTVTMNKNVIAPKI